MYSKLLNITVIVLTTILWALQMLPKETSNPLLLLVKEHIYWIAGISAFIVVGFHLLDIISTRDTYKKIWLKTLLKHIVDEHLGGDTYSTRISILRRQKGYIVFFKTLWYYLFLNIINNFKNKTWTRAIKSIAVHWFSDYLTIYIRYSYPKAKKSYTYFRLTDNAKNDQYNGVADKCYNEGVEVSVSTEYINDMHLPETMEELTPIERKKIFKYLNDCHFSEINYKSLLQIKKLSNNLYAVPVTQNDQSIWGVVIIDNNSKAKLSFKSRLDTYMSSYMKIINFTLSSLK